MTRPRGIPPTSDAQTPVKDADQLDDVLHSLDTTLDGLSGEEAAERLERYGRNALAERTRNPLGQFLSYLWGPIPWMIEVAAILSVIDRHWADLVIIVALLLFNAAVGFLQEFQAANAVDALKRQLALKARVRRDGSWRQIDAAELVPGDVLRLRLGDIVPGDVKLADGDFLSVDQSALTGESLPVQKRAGDAAYSGSVVKQGEMVAVVTATGSRPSSARRPGWWARRSRCRTSSVRCCASVTT